jgi:uncharacterized protein (TIGR00296 family)
MLLTKKQGTELITLARQSIDSYLHNTKLNLTKKLKETYAKEQGVFVTLNLDGNLRGCIGYPEPTLPLYKAIIDAARAAAFDDPRFPELTKEEFKHIKIEISVLTIPEELDVKSPEDYIKKIKIGEDGLIIRSRFGSGLLLPQVFTEYECSVEQSLEMTCQKAGLSSDEWKNLENKFYKFQAQIFKE